MKHKILVVDDVRDNRLMLATMLEDDYDVVEVESGEDCLATIDDVLPDLILLDVNMPGMSGYEVCVALRKQSQFSTLPIIFVSAADTIEERLAGFEAGGDEYVTKPIDAQTLIDKVQHRLSQQRKISEAKASATQAMSVAMEAMTSSSELGQIISFVKLAQAIERIDEMGAKLIDIASEFGLTASVCVESSDTRYYGCQADSLEAKLLQRSLSASDRLVHFGVRTIVKGDYVAMLIKNMPIDDPARLGRMNDHLAVIISIADGRMTTMLNLHAAEQQRRQLLDDVIETTEEKLALIEQNLLAYNNKVTRVMEELVSDMEERMLGLGLEEDQEATLIQLAYQATDKLQAAAESKKTLQDSFNIVLDSLINIRDNH